MLHLHPIHARTILGIIAEDGPDVLDQRLDDLATGQHTTGPSSGAAADTPW